MIYHNFTLRGDPGQLWERIRYVTNLPSIKPWIKETEITQHGDEFVGVIVFTDEEAYQELLTWSPFDV